MRRLLLAMAFLLRNGSGSCRNDPIDQLREDCAAEGQRGTNGLRGISMGMVTGANGNAVHQASKAILAFPEA